MKQNKKVSFWKKLIFPPMLENVLVDHSKDMV